VRFFDIHFAVRVYETSPTEPIALAERPIERELVVSVEIMGNDATPEDAVEVLARKLASLCNDAPPYDGD
jgi:hypothetical protein